MKIDDADNPKTWELIAECSQDLMLERIRLEQQLSRIKGLFWVLKESWWPHIVEIKMSILERICDYKHFEVDIASHLERYIKLKNQLPELCKKYPNIDPELLFQEYLKYICYINPKQKYMFYVILPRFEEHYNKLYWNQCQ